MPSTLGVGDDAPGTAYETRYTYEDGSHTDLVYYVEEDTGRDAVYRYNVSEMKTTYRLDEDGEPDDSTEEIFYEYPQYHGHNDLEPAVAYCRASALDTWWSSAP